MKRKLVLLAKLAVATGLLWYLLRSGKLDLGHLVDRLSEARSWVWIAVAQGLVFAMLFLSAVRWYLLLRAQGIRYRLREIFSLGMIGFFFNQFVPGATGGDLVKAYYVAVERRDLRTAGVTTVVLDRVIGLVVLVGVAGGAILFNQDWIRSDAHLRFLAALISGGLLTFFVASLFFFNERARRIQWVRALVRRLPLQAMLGRIQESIYLYRRHPGTIALAVLLSCGVQLSVVVACYCFALALGGGDVGLVSFFFLVPIAHLAMAVPVSPPGGLGVGEWAFTELFRKVGYVDGGLIALLQRVNWYLWALAGLACFLSKRRAIRRALALASEQDQGEETPVGETSMSPRAAVVGADSRHPSGADEIMVPEESELEYER